MTKPTKPTPTKATKRQPTKRQPTEATLRQSILVHLRTLKIQLREEELDEIGFDRLERREYPESPSLLYKVVDARSGRGSTAFITNVDFSQWTDYLGDPPLVMALLDRVVDNAIVVRFDGKSYRQHRAERKQSPGSK